MLRFRSSIQYSEIQTVCVLSCHSWAMIHLTWNISSPDKGWSARTMAWPPLMYCPIPKSINPNTSLSSKMSLSVLLFSVLLVMFQLRTTQACSCAGIPNLRETYYLKGVVNVVQAKVVRIRGTFPRAKYVFRVEKNFKGCPPPPKFTYKTRGTSCDVSFTLGSSYILPLKNRKKQKFFGCQVRISCRSASQYSALAILYMFY